MLNKIENDNELIIWVGHKFVYSMHKEFASTYTDKREKFEKISVDLEATNKIDIGGLAMLLKMKEILSVDKKFIHIINCNDNLRAILYFCGFDELFTITPSL